MSPIRESQFNVNILSRHSFLKNASLFIVAGLLVACADESGPVEDRRFANEPATGVAEVATPTSLPPQTPVPTMPPMASPEALLNIRDAPEVIFVESNGRIEVIDTVNVDLRGSIVLAKAQIVDFASSPDGELVAVLTMSTTQTGAFDVVVFDHQGQEVQRWSDLGGLTSPAATPVTSEEDDALPGGFINWAAGGNRLLVSTNGSDLISIEIAGSPLAIAVPARVQNVVDGSWSPLGDQVAWLSRDEDGAGAIWVMDPFVDGLSARQVTPPDADAFDLGSVTEFAWLPDGSGFVYILSADAGVASGGGQLFAFDLTTNQRDLVATPGRGGPSAKIVDFAVSPDGQVVAYSISIPNGEQWQFHSLWVRALESSDTYRVPLAQTDRINEIWWTGSGLAWQQQSGDELDIVLQSQSMNLEFLREHGVEPIATPGPGATPAASPITATPQAATPIATPDLATPVEGSPNTGTPVSTPQDQGTPRG